MQLVLLVTAFAMASKSCSKVFVNGTITGVAPATLVIIGYASKERQAKITSLPTVDEA